MITVPYYTMIVLLVTSVTAIATPLISMLYDPTRPYMVNKRRNIQHNPPTTELRILACIHDEASVPGVINLLEISNPTVSSPFCVYALHLIEIVARATPVFIDHETEGKEPFDKEREATTGTDGVHHRVQSMNTDVLSHAPCSVAVLVDRGPFQKHLGNISMASSPHHSVVLFLGGADSREALTYADRMAGNPNLSLTVIRFLSHDEKGDNKMEKKLDDGLVTWFWVKNEGNNRVVYREVIVKNGNETIAAIQAMSSDCDLFITGRKNGINPVIVEGLSNWSENHELGIIGDYVASSDLGSTASILVVQQQILRG